MALPKISKEDWKAYWDGFEPCYRCGEKHLFTRFNSYFGPEMFAECENCGVIAGESNEDHYWKRHLEIRDKWNQKMKMHQSKLWKLLHDT